MNVTVPPSKAGGFLLRTEHMQTDTAAQTDGVVIKNTPALRSLVVTEFKRIDKFEEEIAERRDDIKACIRRLVDRGLNKGGVKAALARRKLLVKGGLEEMDGTLAIICGIGPLGIQGQLFGEEEDMPDGV